MFAELMSWIDYPLFSLGDIHFSLRSMATALVALFVLFWLSRKLSQGLERLISRHGSPHRMGHSLVQIVRYSILIIGAFVILQNVGIDLSTLGLLSGAIGVGLGFGLQNIVNNFISGIIILFEQPIKVGDRIELNHIEGDVTQIGPRSTHVRTNDNITIIVPNSKFIADNVVNWTLNEELVRFKIPFCVEPTVDFAELEHMLVQRLATLTETAAHPAPSIRLMGFGERGLNVEARVWSSTLVHRKGLFTSQVNRVIYDALREHHIRIPSPKREVLIQQADKPVDD